MTHFARPLILGVLFGLAAGFGLSQLLQMPSVTGPGTPILASGARDVGMVQDTRLPTSMTSPVDPGDEGLVRTPASTELSSRVSDIVIDSALGKPTSTQPRTGDSWLEAFVLGDAGQPLLGATVTARPSVNRNHLRPPLGGSAPAQQDPRSRLRETAERIAIDRANLFSGITDSAGRVRFEGIPQATWTVNAYLEGFVIERSPVHAPVHSNSTVNFNAQPTPSLSITILAPDGTPVEEAIIEVKTSAGEFQYEREVQYRWNQNEPFRLREGIYTLRALSHERLQETESMRFSRLASEAEPMEVYAGQASAPLTLQLAPRTGIFGRILQADGAPAEESELIYVLKLVPGQTPSPDLLKGEGVKRVNTISGTFELLDIEPGTYLLGLLRSDYLRRSSGRDILTTETVSVETGVVEKDLVIPDLGPEGTLRITTLGPADRPLNVDSLRIKVTNSDGGSNTQTINTRRESTGVYILRKPDFMREDAATEATYSIHATHSRYAPCTLTFPKNSSEVLLRFIEPASLEVAITGFAGHELADRLTLSVRTLSGENNSSRNDKKKADETGSYLFKGLQPGGSLISLNLFPSNTRSRWDAGTIARMEVNLKKGTNYAQINIPTLFSLSVLASGAKEGRSVSVRPTRESTSGDDSQPRTRYKQSRFNQDGRAMFTEVLPGSYWVQSENFKTAKVEVPCGEVSLEPDKQKRDR